MTQNSSVAAAVAFGAAPVVIIGMALMIILFGASPDATGSGPCEQRDSSGCTVSGDAKTLATQLVAAIDDGRLRFITSDGFDYAQQVHDAATGTSAPNCGVDTRILQIVSVALSNFGSVGISDLNRQCTGVLAGAGTGSAHWIDGGGHAVDLTALDGVALTGCDANSVRLLRILDPMVPPGTRAGQAQCRRDEFTNIDGFDDTENHLHVDVAYATGGPAA
ncbi:hypothetical protein HQQ81_20125 [Microbacteriaceae bacterium VKM Ac-2854]|nr:hypothetical protein [Microbacteriaceae bacterium VKM Ac-2854]